MNALLQAKESAEGRANAARSQGEELRSQLEKLRSPSAGTPSAALSLPPRTPRSRSRTSAPTPTSGTKLGKPVRKGTTKDAEHQKEVARLQQSLKETQEELQVCQEVLLEQERTIAELEIELEEANLRASKPGVVANHEIGQRKRSPSRIPRDFQSPAPATATATAATPSASPRSPVSEGRRGTHYELVEVSPESPSKTPPSWRDIDQVNAAAQPRESQAPAPAPMPHPVVPPPPPPPLDDSDGEESPVGAQEQSEAQPGGPPPETKPSTPSPPALLPPPFSSTEQANSPTLSTESTASRPGLGLTKLEEFLLAQEADQQNLSPPAASTAAKANGRMRSPPAQLRQGNGPRNTPSNTKNPGNSRESDGAPTTTPGAGVKSKLAALRAESAKLKQRMRSNTSQQAATSRPRPLTSGRWRQRLRDSEDSDDSEPEGSGNETPLHVAFMGASTATSPNPGTAASNDLSPPAATPKMKLFHSFGGETVETPSSAASSSRAFGNSKGFAGALKEKWIRMKGSGGSPSGPDAHYFDEVCRLCTH